MGLFDWLKPRSGGRGTEGEAPAPSTRDRAPEPPVPREPGPSTAAGPHPFRPMVMPVPPPPVSRFDASGWRSEDDDEKVATSRAFLGELGRLLLVTDMVVVARPEDSEIDLRGSIAGYPLKISVDRDGDLRDLTFRYAGSRLAFMDLEFDPEMPEQPQTPAVEPWDASDKIVVLAPQVFIEGSDADKEAAAFRKLPGALQQRVLAEIKRLRIRYFRSRPDEFDVTMHDDPNDVSDPLAWLVDVVMLAVDVAKARGATPPGANKQQAEAEPLLHARELARTIARKINGAKVVERAEDQEIDVRWTTLGVPVRIVIDYDFDSLTVEARADGAAGSFTLMCDPEVDVDEPPASADEWDDTEHHVFFAESVHVSGREAAARAEAALLQGLGSALLEELVRTVEQEPDRTASLDGHLLDLSFGDASDISDDGAAAIEVAQLLARIARALPRAPVATTELVRCPECHALYVRSPTRTSCVHCDE